jgi:hypothetical protein
MGTTFQGTQISTVAELFFNLPSLFSCFGSVRLFTFQFCAFSSRFKSAYLALAFQNCLPILYSSVCKSNLYAPSDWSLHDQLCSILRAIPIVHFFSTCFCGHCNPSLHLLAGFASAFLSWFKFQFCHPLLCASTCAIGSPRYVVFDF